MGHRILCAALFAGLAACAAGPRLRATPEGRVEARGLSAAEAAELATEGALVVRVATSPDVQPPPVVGALAAEGRRLVWAPRFPLEPGLDYRATLTSADGTTRELAFALPRQEREPSTVVTAIQPAGPVPANVLRFYVQFSAPMARGQAYRHLRLVDDRGEVVEGAFLELEPELWDPAATRLTLLVPPGRIKRGLVPREEEGPVFLPDRSWAIAVDPAWHDAEGAPLAAGFRHVFRTGSEDHSPPDPARWVVEPPDAGGRAPLVVQLDEALDTALLERVVTVEGPAGPIAATARALDGARTLELVPERSWRPGLHALVVEAVLEDLAGNSPGRPFEVALTGASSGDARPVRVPFEVR